MGSKANYRFVLALVAHPQVRNLVQIAAGCLTILKQVSCG